MTRQPQATPDRRLPDGVDQATSREGLGAQVPAASRRLELEDPDRGLGLADRVVNRAVELVGVSLIERALQGDTKAAALIINMIARFLDQTEDEEQATPLAETDRAILDAYVTRMTANRKSRSTT